MTTQPERIVFVTRRPLLALRFRELLQPTGFEREPLILNPEHRAAGVVSEGACLTTIDDEANVPWDMLESWRGPAAGSRLLLWCGRATPELVQRAITGGLDGLLSMQLPVADAAEVLVRIWRGERQFRFPGELQTGPSSECGLTPREQEVVMLIRQGMRNKEIASALHTTEGSVKVYLSRVFAKTGVKSRHELALVASGVTRRAHEFNAVWMFSSGAVTQFPNQGEI